MMQQLTIPLKNRLKTGDFPKNKINWCGSVSSVFEKSVGQI
jgi:hypothetical protein